MENPLSSHHKEEVLKGGQMAIVIGFIATFLLGVVFVFVMGNLLSQVSEGVQQVNVELSGTKQLIVQTSAYACLNGAIRAENAGVLAATDKTDALKLEEILAKYDSDMLVSLESSVTHCASESLPTYIGYGIDSVGIEKTGEGLSVEAVTRNILNL